MRPLGGGGRPLPPPPLATPLVLNDVLNGPQTGIAGTHSGLHQLWLKRLLFANKNMDVQEKTLLIRNPLEHLQYVKAPETGCYK